MSGMECSRLHDLAPELALGLLDGAERAEALAHLERCVRCHADVASLTELGEQLLLLAPSAPPPAGFESRVLERVDEAAQAAAPGDRPEPTPAPRPAPATPRSRPRRWRTSRLLIAAAAVIALVGAFAGVLARMSGDDPPEVVATAPMENPRGDAIGTVELLAGSPPAVRIDMAEWWEEVEHWTDPPQGPYRLQVVDESGRLESYELPDDDPTPDVTLDHGDVASVHHVSVLDGEGHILCTGRLG
jgi:anti-sigma factor RsiW